MKLTFETALITEMCENVEWQGESYRSHTFVVGEVVPLSSLFCRLTLSSYSMRAYLKDQRSIQRKSGERTHLGFMNLKATKAAKKAKITHESRSTEKRERDRGGKRMEE